jgi:hypothetical protein
VALGLVLTAAGCGEKSEPDPATPPPATAPQAAGGPSDEPDAAGQDKPKPDGPDPAAVAAARRRAAERTVRRYIEALDARDGGAVCSLLVRGALAGVELPRERGSCAASLNASIGYRDPRGLPQFESVKLADLPSTEAARNSARVTATLVTTFADRQEPSIEDDIIYLARNDGRLEVAKASSALYRAIGTADIPPQVISPPKDTQ